MRNSKQTASLPSWLWFFLALPIGLVAAILWQRRRVQNLLHREVTVIRGSRYIEPDSIPIDTRPSYDMSEMEEAYDTDHAFAISEAALDEAKRTSKVTVTPKETEPDRVDDLKMIDGIGPKIAGILMQNGIKRFDQLAGTSLERLTEILTEAGIIRISDPGTWAEQASLAAENDWEGLKNLQATFKGGRRLE